MEMYSYVDICSYVCILVLKCNIEMYSYVVCLWVNHTGNSSKECTNALLKTTLPLN